MSRTLTTPTPTDAHTLSDGCGRRIDHLRLSLTDRCNLACSYCATGAQQRPVQIDAAFAVAVVRWLSVRHGVNHLRLTGGEPLLHPGLLTMVTSLSRLATLKEITLTTNGQALACQAAQLRKAGLNRVNVSLDTLDADRFARLTRGGTLAHTLRGIEAAIRAGLNPVRLNVVVQRGINDDQLCDLAEWGLTRGCTVRFLEMMPVGPMADAVQHQLVPASEIVDRLSNRFALRSVLAPVGQPATDYAAMPHSGAATAGVVGIIASTTRPFCGQCRRLRITARGEILSCLFDSTGSSLARAWNGRELDEGVADRILQAAVIAKPAMGPRAQRTQMISIGG